MLTSLPKEIEEWRVKIEKIARDYGLDFFPTLFEVVDWKQMNMVAALGGFPNRYPHWRFGMEYEQLSKSYAYGLSKIYELVINNNPCYAYLLHSNPLLDQKLVMAHVFGHCDFFKNNIYFANTNRHMIDVMANHRSKVLRYVDKYGYEKVESFIDTCLRLDNLIDYQLPFLKKSEPKKNPDPDFEDGEVDISARQSTPKLKASRGYLESYINPKEFLDEQEKRMDDKRKAKVRFPEENVKDVMGFLLETAPLERWQHDILDIIRDEAYYFAPQGQTKIMNEGWASFWHSKIMTQNVLDDSEIIDFADHHSGTMAT